MTMRRFETMADDQLVTLYAQGCNEAFDALLMRYDAFVHTYIRFSCSDAELVEDIFQEAFIKVMMTIRQGRYSAEGKFKQWLTRITHNLIMDHFRRMRTESRFEPLEREDGLDFITVSIASEEPNAEEQILSSDMLAELYDRLTYLPMEQREVVMLRYWQDMSFKDIAEHTGVSINTALGRMRYALINLRKQMSLGS